MSEATTIPLTARELAIVRALRRELEVGGPLRPHRTDENVLDAAPLFLEYLARDRQDAREERAAARELHEAVVEGCLYLSPPMIVQHGPDDPRDLLFENESCALRLKRDAALVRIMCARAGKVEVALRAIRGALPPETLEVEP